MTRDMGHVFDVESFVVPVGKGVDLGTIEAALRACEDINWKVQDMVVTPVGRILPDLLPESMEDRT